MQLDHVCWGSEPTESFARKEVCRGIARQAINGSGPVRKRRATPLRAGEMLNPSSDGRSRPGACEAEPLMLNMTLQCVNVRSSPGLKVFCTSQLTRRSLGMLVVLRSGPGPFDEPAASNANPRGFQYSATALSGKQ